MVASDPVVPTVGQRYRKIFASYSRRDIDIVRSFETFARGLGDRYLIDLLDLRAGEVWSKRLEEMIRSADVFQLFWSQNAMASQHVMAEVECALAISKDIRPIYWERPLPQDPSRNLPPPALAQFHFQFLSSKPGNPADPAGDPYSEHLESPHAPGPPAPPPPDPALTTEHPARAPLGRGASTQIVACSACGQHNVRSNLNCVSCGTSLATSIKLPDDLYDPFDSGDTRAIEPDALDSDSDDDAWPEAGSHATGGAAFPVVLPPSQGSYGANTPIHPDSASEALARPARGGGSLLTVVVTAFGLAVLIVSGLMLIWFNT